MQCVVLFNLYTMRLPRIKLTVVGSSVFRLSVGQIPREETVAAIVNGLKTVKGKNVSSDFAKVIYTDFLGLLF